MSKAIKIGDKVRFVDRKAHEQTPEYYPSVGTIGTVVMDEYNPKDWKIQWPKGTTSGNDRWYCEEESIELFDGKIEKDEMTNEEIWEMLKPKIEKNEIKPCSHHYMFGAVYNKNDVINAIAVAYRSGYIRAMKGRPFKFGEKKKKQGGHWEPVDIEDVLKGEYKVVENCLGWQYEHLGTYKKGEDGKFYQWVEDDE